MSIHHNHFHQAPDLMSLQTAYETVAQVSASASYTALKESSRKNGSHIEEFYTPKDCSTKSTDSLERLPLKGCRDKTGSEKPKAIISRSKRQWLLVVFIHMVPVLATAIIAAINIEGYFIGTTLVGVGDTKSQSLALLSLQITAKLLEIAVIISLGFIVLEIVHYFLFSSGSGLPLALSGIKLMFTSLFYLGSPSFWYGISALGSRSTRICIAFLLVSCGLLANLIGPSAALLLIPINNSQWSAGGLRFSVPQNTMHLWPAELDSSHVGGLDCFDPVKDTVNDPDADYSRCIWYATTTISAHVNDDSTWNGNYTLDDEDNNQQYSRYISWFTYAASSLSPVQWNWSSMSIANIITGQLFVNWALAANGTKNLSQATFGRDISTWSFWSKYSRYSDRDPWGSQAELIGMLGPVARTSCIGQLLDFTDTGTLPYPVMPLYGNYGLDTNATYMIETHLIPETSVVRSIWIPKPVGKIEVANSQENQTESLPSAFLLLQFPLNSTSAGVVFTCSIDARWTNLTTNFDIFNDRQFLMYGVPPTYARLKEATFDEDGRPIAGQSSSPVQLDLSWLNALTPSFNETNSKNHTDSPSIGYNTISKALDTIPRNLINEDLYDWTYLMTTSIESFLPSLIVDGMARSNLHELLNGGMGNIQEEWLLNNSSSDPTILLAGGGGTAKLASTQSPSTEFLWTVSISGYAYSANSTASTMALVILFSYLVFALGHIGFTLYKRWTSFAWIYIPEIIALCQNSPQSTFLQNVASGIDSKYTNRLLLKLRVPNSHDEDDKEEETIHVLVSNDRQDSEYGGIIGYHKIESDKKYS